MATPTGAKSFFFYCAVLLVAGSGVVFGLDWTRAPLPPMPETEATVQAAKLAAKFPPPVVRVVKVEPKPAPVKVVVPAQPKTQTQKQKQTAAIAPATQQPAQNAATAPPIMAPEQPAEQAATPEPSEQPKCDIDACSVAYRSFRASDCTWQPYEGPRRFCDKGTPPQNVATLTPAQQTANTDIDQPVVSDKCDIEACKHAYFTFTSEDCTYQPSNGPRRLCTKGNPPKPNIASTDPEKAADDAANAATKTDTKPDQTAQPAASNKCDIEACKRAYFTFTPEDCTYQPSDGPRRLCTKGNPPKPEIQPEAKAEPIVAPPPVAPEPPVAAPAAPTAPPAAAATPNGEQVKQETPAAAPAPTVTTPAVTTPPAAATAAPPIVPADEQTKQETPAPSAAAPAVSDKCDVDACKQAYFTFNPADCTYQPSNGPRRLCTKGTPKKPQAAAPTATPAPRRVAPDRIVPPALVPAGR